MSRRYEIRKVYEKNVNDRQSHPLDFTGDLVGYTLIGYGIYFNKPDSTQEELVYSTSLQDAISLLKHLHYFPNGFDNWYETHHVIVESLTNWPDVDDFQHHVEGMGNLWAEGAKWTNEFEEMYQGRQWDGDWLDTVEEFIESKKQEYYMLKNKNKI